MPEPSIQIGRRAFVKSGTLVLLTARAGAATLTDEGDDSLNIGLVTDLHFADKPAAGTRHYRETLDKLTEAGRQFHKDKPDFIVELGDFVDAADTVSAERGYLQQVNKHFSSLCEQRHYVLGNHCVYTLTKEEFLGGVEQTGSHYSFDHGGFHFVVLDSCYRSDGVPYGRKNFQWTDPNIPADQVEWLKGDLQETAKPTILFAHQRLDGSNHYCVKNSGEVRRVLEDSGRVSAVFQGHSHKNDYKNIAGIHYCTLVAMVEGSGAENNGYAVMNVASDQTIRVNGFRHQDSYRW
jgi:alkaline phosphatase